MLKAGEPIASGAGPNAIVNEKPIEWSAEDLGGALRHRDWTRKLPPGARLTWPVYPLNPYRSGLETDLAHAVETLSSPLTGNQELDFAVEVN